MADVNLSLGIDPSEGVSGARQFVAAADSAGAASKRAAKDTAFLGASVSDTAKRFGFLKRDMNDFAKFGASAFAGDIIAKSLGFSNVIGLIGAGTALAATGIRGMGVALRDVFYPEIRRAAEEQARFAEASEKVADALRAINAEKNKNVFELTGPLGSAKFDLSGLTTNDIEAVLTGIASKQRLIDSLRKRDGDRVAREEQSRQIVEVDRYIERLRGVNKLVAEGEDAEKRRLANARALAEAERRIAHELESQRKLYQTLTETRGGAPEVQGPYGPLTPGVFDFPQDGGTGGQYDSKAAIRRQAQFFAAQNPNIIGRSIIDAFRSSAATIAQALSSGSPETPYAAERFNYERNEDVTRAAEKQLALIRQIKAEEQERNQLATRFFSDSIGNRIAQGFEDAVIAGNRLRDVLRGLLEDLERIVLRSLVTQPLGNYLAGAISGVVGGLTGGGTGASGGVGGGTSAPISASGGGPITVVMHVHTPDANSFRQSSRQISEDLSRKIRR